MPKRTALLTGSMNPFTLGHKHLVDTSLLVFDEVIIGIAQNPNKTGPQLFSAEQKSRIVQSSLAEHGARITISFFNGATVDHAFEQDVTAIVRGLRDETDQVYEASMSHANGLISTIEHGRFIPTIYIPCPPALTEISSSRVRELIELRRSPEVLRQYVLAPVVELIVSEIYN